MSDLQIRDVSEADMIPMTEEEFARYDNKARGTHLILHNNPWEVYYDHKFSFSEKLNL
jgi:hypothetical protein